MPDNQLLSDALQRQFNELDELARQHQEALAHEAALERVQFIQYRVKVLHHAIKELLAVAQLLEALGDSAGMELWEATRMMLRETAVPAYQSPASVIVEGGLDLLYLVDYTGASLARISERRDVMCQRLLSHFVTLNAQPFDTEYLKRLVDSVIQHIVETPGLDIDATAQELGFTLNSRAQARA